MAAKRIFPKTLSLFSLMLIGGSMPLSIFGITFDTTLPAVAQAPALPGAGDPGSSGPIDIVANEQEFAGDHVIARGNVRVLFKDSVIVAPLATLYRDPLTGQPQRAIFTGHPRLTQGVNKIDADTLTFEMATSKIVADGHAHSEVINQSNAQAAPATAKAKTEKDKPVKVAQADPESGEGESEADPDAAETAPKVATTGSGSAAASEPAPTKIITDADKQIYDKATGQFEAYGKVRVRAGDINVTSDTLKMAYGVDTKPEAAIFTGHVSATQGTNNTQADRMTYFLNTKRLQADGHVRSKVIQQGRGSSQPAPVQPTTQEPTSEPIVNGATGKGALMQTQPLVNGGSKVGFSFSEGESTAPIIIVSDSQDYSKETGRLTAFGNVKIFYQDTVGIGPKVILVRNVEGQAERVYFVGRSQITQPGKRWIADKIVMTVADRKVLAEGNTRAIILPKKQAEPASNFQLAQSQKKQLSSSRVEMAQ